MTSAWIGAAAAVILLAVICLWWVPRQPRRNVTSEEIDADFSRETRDREELFHRRLRGWGYLSLLIGLVLPTVLTVSGLVAHVANLFQAGWFVQSALAVGFISVMTWVVGLVASIRMRMVMRDVGLATGSWVRWWRDALLAELIGLVLAAGAVGGVVGAARIWPRSWWIPVAVAGVLVVVLLSFILPVVIEPVFNSFTPLGAGQLRDSLLDLARRDGVQVRDVLVADASRRTSALNAYVSGLGPTRRIVVNDNLIDRGKDDEVVAVVAHELGHVVARDVLFGTLAGACGIAAVVFGAALLLENPVVLQWGHAGGAADPASAGLLITLGVWVSFLVSPLTNGVSRRIERQADQHSFDLIEDPQAMVRMHQSLAVHNLASLAPHRLRYLWFASHPTSPERIKAARSHVGRSARSDAASGG